MVGAMEPNSEASPSGSSHRHGPGAASDRVVLVGGDCPLGIALLDAWEAAGIAATVIGRVLDGAPTTLADHPVIHVGRHGAVAAALAGADELVILAASGVRDVDGSGIGLVDEGLVAAVLRSAAERPPAHVTVVSSALGYDRRRRSVPSARSTEVDPFGLPLALRHLPAALAGRVRAERSATSWGDRHRVPVAALRPVLCASLSARGWYDRSGWRVRRVRPSPWPTVQYVHVRDVVAAVETVREGRRRGTYNVAPDDLLDGPTIAELADRHVGIGAPSWVLVALDQIRWSTWWSPTPPSLVQVVSSDLAVDASGLKALGWSASHSSAEAFLVAHAPAWWPSLSARRRQDLVLGGSATILVAIVGGVGWAVTSRWRRRVRRPTPASPQR
jgi:nucleoside-diphosphate-sugar epimerase